MIFGYTNVYGALYRVNAQREFGLWIRQTDTHSIELRVTKGSRCPDCGNSTLIGKNGCNWCPAG